MVTAGEGRKISVGISRASEQEERRRVGRVGRGKRKEEKKKKTQVGSQSSPQWNRLRWIS